MTLYSHRVVPFLTCLMLKLNPNIDKYRYEKIFDIPITTPYNVIWSWVYILTLILYRLAQSRETMYSQRHRHLFLYLKVSLHYSRQVDWHCRSACQVTTVLNWLVQIWMQKMTCFFTFWRNSWVNYNVILKKICWKLIEKFVAILRKCIRNFKKY